MFVKLLNKIVGGSRQAGRRRKSERGNADRCAAALVSLHRCGAKVITLLLMLIYIMRTEEQSIKTGSIECGCHGLSYTERRANESTNNRKQGARTNITQCTEA